MIESAHDFPNNGKHSTATLSTTHSRPTEPSLTVPSKGSVARATSCSPHRPGTTSSRARGNGSEIVLDLYLAHAAADLRTALSLIRDQLRDGL